MRVWKTAKWVAVFLVVALVGTAAVLYVLASRIPSEYRPTRLTQQQKEDAAYEFVNRKLIRELSNPAQEQLPFDWSITEDEINRYVASMDEIAWLGLDWEPGRMQGQLDEAGLAEPAVSLGDGTLTLMVRDTNRQKVLSVTLVPEEDEGRLGFRLVGARVGQLSVPRSIVAGQIEQLQRQLAEEHLNDEDAEPGAPVEQFGRMLAGLLAGDDPQVEPVFTAGINRRRVRVSEVAIADKKLTLRLEPVLSGRQ